MPNQHPTHPETVNPNPALVSADPILAAAEAVAKELRAKRAEAEKREGRAIARQDAVARGRQARALRAHGGTSSSVRALLSLLDEDVAERHVQACRTWLAESGEAFEGLAFGDALKASDEEERAKLLRAARHVRALAAKASQGTIAEVIAACVALGDVATRTYADLDSDSERGVAAARIVRAKELRVKREAMRERDEE